jgi:nucleotide-binding universal stress UspA family protein
VILICYDGSADAKVAIARAGELFDRQPATVLTVWQPFVQVLLHMSSGLALTPDMLDTGEIDAASRTNAEQSAQQGAELARQAGFEATPRCRKQETTTANAILVEADALDVNAIVMGSRGLTGLKSLLLGSVSHAVIQHADCTVVVTPSPEVAAARARDRRAVHETSQPR